LFVGATRPPGYTTYLLINLLTVASAYFLVPIDPFRLLMACSICSLLEFIALLTRHAEAGELVFIVAFVSFAGANLVGAFGVSRLNGALRREYLAFEQAEERSAQLKEALANVKTLQGLLPMCAHCKKIREIDGQWFSLERYVESHSSAQMSHGICPDCLTKHYPEYTQRSNPS
jgi:hypothetical protein